MKYTFKGPHELRVSARMVLRFELKDVYWKQVDGQAGIILCCLLVKECTGCFKALGRRMRLLTGVF